MGYIMRIEISKMGSIRTYNDKDNLHSFNGKPSIVMRDGRLVWHNDGDLVKAIWPDGQVIRLFSPKFIVIYKDLF